MYCGSKFVHPAIHCSLSAFVGSNAPVYVVGSNPISRGFVKLADAINGDPAAGTGFGAFRLRMSVNPNAPGPRGVDPLLAYAGVSYQAATPAHCAESCTVDEPLGRALAARVTLRICRLSAFAAAMVLTSRIRRPHG